MTADTCAVLAAVFPLVMLTLAVERRLVGLKLRRKIWFRRAVLVGFTACVIGLPISVLGVQADGLDLILAYANWMAAGVAFLTLAVMVLMVMATSEAEEDGYPLT